MKKMEIYELFLSDFIIGFVSIGIYSEFHNTDKFSDTLFFGDIIAIIFMGIFLAQILAVIVYLIIKLVGKIKEKNRHEFRY
jgi:uncharacterized membrane protein